MIIKFKKFWCHRNLVASAMVTYEIGSQRVQVLSEDEQLWAEKFRVSKV